MLTNSKISVIIFKTAQANVLKNSVQRSKKMQTTSKKQKFIRSKVLYDENGEAIPFQEVMVEERDFNFHKVWLQHFINSLDSISNQKLKLAFWIVDNLNCDNQLIMTQRKISEKTGMSLYTVVNTMKALQEGEPPFLIRINSGAYQVNPDIIWKGNHSKRMGIVYDYNTKASESRSERQEEPEQLEGQLSFDEEKEHA